MQGFSEENLEKLAAVFPEVMTESRGKDGNVHRAVDFERLRMLLTGEVPDTREYYSFTWAGKREAELLAARPTDSVLRPSLEESVNFPDTENLYIEGDNLEALKVLRKSYMHRVKMIYIDPPYNTGHDFIYRDNFRGSAEEERQVYMFDEEGRRNFSAGNYEENTKARPRYHSDWCSMIYSRLLVAKDFLREDGVIFISIDDNEVMNLRKMCDEIFGESNFVSNIIWQSRTSISNDYEVSLNHNHTLIYAKDRMRLVFGGDPKDSSEYINPDNDPRGAWKLVPIDANHTGGATVYPITNPKTGVDYYPPNGRVWCYNKKTLQSLIADGRIKFGLSDDSSPKRKLYLNERIERGDVKTPSSLLLDAGTTQTGTNEIMTLFGGKKVFSYPKPVEFLRRLISYGAPQNDSIILDFFAGSSTTAHATISLNSQDFGHRKFIMIQLPELCPPNSEAAKAGFSTIADIGRERIKRASHSLIGDTGFRSLHVDSSNFRPEAFISPNEPLTPERLDSLVENIKPDRSPLDLLFMCITDFGLPLSLPYKAETFDGFTLHFYGGLTLAACFDKDISESLVVHLAKLQPEHVIFRDSCFKDSATKINLDQLFRHYAPKAQVKIL